MIVIALMSSKGGVGKTLISLLLSQYLSKSDLSVCYLDIDETRQADIFVQKRIEMDLPIPFEYYGISDRNEVIDFIDNSIDQDKYDVMIVDTPGHIMDMNTGLLSRTNLTLIPINGAEQDIQLAIRTQAKIRREERTLGRKLPYAFVFTRIPAAIPSFHFQASIKELKEAGVPYIKQILHDRKPFFHASLGLLISEMSVKINGKRYHSLPTVEKAHKEALEFSSEVIDMINKIGEA